VPAASSPAGIALRAYAIGIYVLTLSVVVRFLLVRLAVFFDAQFLGTRPSEPASSVDSRGSWWRSAGWVGCPAGRSG
jgi:hypothetical protein